MPFRARGIKIKFPSKEKMNLVKYFDSEFQKRNENIMQDENVQEVSRSEDNKKKNYPKYKIISLDDYSLLDVKFQMTYRQLWRIQSLFPFVTFFELPLEWRGENDKLKFIPKSKKSTLTQNDPIKKIRHELVELSDEEEKVEGQEPCKIVFTQLPEGKLLLKQKNFRQFARILWRETKKVFNNQIVFSENEENLNHEEKEFFLNVSLDSHGDSKNPESDILNMGEKNRENQILNELEPGENQIIDELESGENQILNELESGENQRKKVEKKEKSSNQRQAFQQIRMSEPSPAQRRTLEKLNKLNFKNPRDKEKIGLLIANNSSWLRKQHLERVPNWSSEDLKDILTFL